VKRAYYLIAIPTNQHRIKKWVKQRGHGRVKRGQGEYLSAKQADLVHRAFITNEKYGEFPQNGGKFRG
jgi:hypothetical protein